jgi:hypothetical protein
LRKSSYSAYRVNDLINLSGVHELLQTGFFDTSDPAEQDSRHGICAHNGARWPNYFGDGE